MDKKYKRIFDNVYIFNSPNMKIELTQGDRCFLIGHHVKLQSILNETSAKLVMGGFRYFNIFGEQAHLWEKTISQKSGTDKDLHIEASTVAREEMCYNLAMFASLELNHINFVLSDDDYFTEYLIEDLHDIISGKSRFTPYDWQKFRSGFEFKYHGKDAIVSICNGVMTGFLGEERKFDTIYKGFRYKLFDGKCFDEIWEDISKTI